MSSVRSGARTQAGRRPPAHRGGISPSCARRRDRRLGDRALCTVGRGVRRLGEVSARSDSAGHVEYGVTACKVRSLAGEACATGLLPARARWVFGGGFGDGGGGVWGHAAGGAGGVEAVGAVGAAPAWRSGRLLVMLKLAGGLWLRRLGFRHDDYRGGGGCGGGCGES